MTQTYSGDLQGSVERAMRDAVRVHVPPGASGDAALKWMALAAIAAVNVHNQRAGLELVCEPHLWNTRTHVAHAAENPAIMNRMWLAQLRWAVHMLSPDPTKIVVYGPAAMPHGQGFNGHNGATHSTAEALRDILVSDRRKTA